MQPLITELADLILKDNAILFVGAQLGAGGDNSPIVQQIADALATRIDYQRTDRSLPAVARDYEVLQGRPALILALREELARLQTGPDPIHQLVADAVLPTTKLITTRFDQVLERALTQFEKPYVLIVRDTDVPFFDESKITVIKIQGDINQPDSLVITEDDVDAFINNLPTLSDIVRSFFATKTLIFLGYDLNSTQFKRFFNQVTRNLSIYRRTAYAIVPPDTDGMDAVGQRYWKNQNVEIVLHDPLSFLEELAQTVKKATTTASRPESRPNPLPAAPLPAQPYKGLQAYGAEDAAIFAGRGQEGMQLANRVLANRLTILYGESGVGKSSLLRAGLGPRIAAQRGLLAVAQPEAGAPLVTNLHASLLAAARRAGLTPDTSGELSDLVRAVQRGLGGPVVLAIDQAEQFFLVYTGSEQTAALAQLQGFVTDRSLDLRFVIAIREDALGSLQPLEAILPNVLNVRYRVERLGREAAREAIENPAALYGVSWEPALVQRLLNDLSDPDGGGVGPPQLQINCDRLYRETIARQPSPPQTISLALFESLGNTTSLLGDYLTQTVQTLETSQQPAARNLLGALVSSSGLKQRLALGDLARFVGIPPAQTLAILDVLVERSLVRRISRPGLVAPQTDGQSVAEFELSHDSLIPRIVSWLGDDFWATQKMREILRQAAPEWTKRARLLPADDLRLATQRRAQLRVTPVEAALLYASAVTYSVAVDDWREALPAAEEQALLLGLLAHPDERARGHAAALLPAFADRESGERLGQLALTDPDASVRQAAITALAAQLETAGVEVAGPGVAAVLAGLEQPATDAIARQALVTLRDLAPASDPLLPPARRSIIQRKVWLARWNRHWGEILAATIRGVQGGFWGLGLGMGPFLGLNIFIADGFSLALLWQSRDSILFGVSAGIPIMGLIGGLTGSVTGSVGAIARYLPDRVDSRRVWLAQTGAGATAMGLGWLIFAIIRPGDVRLWQTLLAGLLLGALLVGASTAPVAWPRMFRLALSLAAGVVAFILLGLLALIYNKVFWWLIVMGLVAGAGFFWAMNPDESD
ncbi:MAG: hypothetical protein DWI57_09995 [Chloroflexi bacterium]|nr:MAG: hypothetical protein DWI57_09995 [Chloroflexota bacterium]